MSDFTHQSRRRADVSVTFAVTRMRWQRAFIDLRSRWDRGGDTDFTYRAGLFSAVLLADLAFVIALFSIYRRRPEGRSGAVRCIWVRSLRMTTPGPVTKPRHRALR